MQRHVTQLHKFYGEFMGVRIARKHVGWYLSNSPDLAAHRRTFNTLDLAGEQLHFIELLSNAKTNEVLAA